MSFAELKRSSKTSLTQLTEELAKINNPTSYSDDERLWQPTVDKVGNGYAIIRFLPPSEGEDMPFVRYWDHGFKGPTGKWYIENSLTSIGKPDPLAEANSKLWDTGIEANKEIVRQRKRRLHYVSNVYVLKDPGNPENEGKVFLYKYGKKIFDKINDLMNPQFEDEKAINPFDLWEGSTFTLKIRKVEGYRNYDKSEFGAAGPLFKDDAKLEEIYKSEYPLKEFTDPKSYKSYEELQAKLNLVLGGDAEALALLPESGSRGSKSKNAPENSVTDEEIESYVVDSDDGEGDGSDLSFFKNLVNAD